MLDHALPSLDSWVLYFSEQELPVLRHTVHRLEEARERMDSVSGREIAGIILQDPMMTVRMLAYIQPLKGRRLGNDITTIDQAVVLMGIEPFFKKFSNLPTVEETLKSQPQALLGLINVVRRAQRAAAYAYDWALWRHDLNMEEVVVATLLHELAELLLWCCAPKLALEIKALQKADRNLRSAVAQEMVLGGQFTTMQQALCRAWSLPELMLKLTDDEHAANPRVRNVLLAANLARHSANGWDDAALPDDYRDIAELLHLHVATVMKKAGAPVPPELEDEEEAPPPPADAAPAPAAPPEGDQPQ
ncbi:MAG TPA: HDOD domain-containing protein [Azospira sp.]|nr:HDOD domain-containing protein [Azospira sp.]